MRQRIPRSGEAYVKVHLSQLAVANPSTPKDANGLFNGCAVPQSCWVPLEVNGQDWYPIKAS